MSTCIKVIEPDGKPSRLFAQLLGEHSGNEQKALEAYAEKILQSGKESFFLATQITDSKVFLNSFFPVTDEFTIDQEQVMRSNASSFIKEYTEKGTNKAMIVYNDAMGFTITRPASEKSQAINELIQQHRTLKNDVGNNLLQTLNSFGSNLKDEAEKNLGKNSYPIVRSLINGLTAPKIRPYKEFSNEPWYIPSLESEKIMVHVKTNSKGQKTYTLLLPSFSRSGEDFNNSGQNFIGKKFLGSNTLSEARGITLQGNIMGRKKAVAALLAASIVNHDPDAKIESARFASFLGYGEFQHLDLGEGVRSLQAMTQLPGFTSQIPAELSFLNSKEGLMDQVTAGLDYVSLLFDQLSASTDGGDFKTEFMKAYTNAEKKLMHDMVNKRMYHIMRTYSREVNGLKEYEDSNTPIGKEFLLLARAKQQLLMKEGFDIRGKNQSHKMGGYESWVFTQGEYANADLNIVFQELQAIDTGVKQRFLNGHVKKMQAAVNELIKNNGGVGVKGRLLNDTQAYFDNLYEQIEVDVLGPDGQLTGEKKMANILMFKDPEDSSNNLTSAERKFIREMISLHKESLIKMVDKKIKDGMIKSHKTGQEWYEKEYKHQERLVPVTRKSTSEMLTNGQINQSWQAFADDFQNVYNLNDKGQTNKDYIFSTYGSATAQMGGIYGNPHTRLKSLGLEYMNGRLVLVNPQKNQSASLNVEQALNLAAYNNEKAAMEMELSTVYAASRVNLLNDKLTERGQETETLKAMFENLVYGDMEKMKLVPGKDVMKPVNALRKITSTGTLALNLKSALLATVGANITLLSDAISQRYGKHFFNAKDYAKAITWITSHLGKFDKLIDLFMFHESDEVNLLYSDKYQASQKGLYKERYNMILHSAGDRLLRGVILVSQLHHDGLIDNFVENDKGELVYDWDKDQRPDDLKKRILENLSDRGIVNLPYDEIMLRSLTTISGKIFGSFTDGDKARFHAHEGMKIFAQFKAYLGARATNLYSQGFENTNIRWYEVGANGEITVNNYYQEGIFQSFVHLYKEVKKLGSYSEARKALRPEQKANINKLFIDVMLFAGSALMYHMVKNALDDDKFAKSDAFRYAEYAWMDIVGIYNLQDYLMAIGTPVMVAYMQRVVRMTWNLAVLDLETAKDQALGLIAPVRTFHDLATIFED